MSFSASQRYERPADADASWYLDALQQVRRERAGDVPIKIETDANHPAVGIIGLLIGASNPGASLEGALTGTTELPESGHGAVVLDGHRAIPCEDIVAFTLLPESGAGRGDEAPD